MWSLNLDLILFFLTGSPNPSHDFVQSFKTKQKIRHKMGLNASDGFSRAYDDDYWCSCLQYFVYMFRASLYWFNHGYNMRMIFFAHVCFLFKCILSAHWFWIGRQKMWQMKNAQIRLNVMDFSDASQTRDITMCICSFGHLSGVCELNIKIQNEKQLVNQKIVP